MLALLCSANVVITTIIGMLGPLLLQLSEQLDVPLAQTGLLASATALPWALCAPILGPLSDRLGRRQVLASSLLGLGLATGLGAFVGSFGLLVVVRVVSGIVASAGPPTVFAAVGDQIPPARRATALGWVNAGFGISALATVPLVGAIGGAFGWRVAFLVAGVATVLLAAIIWVRLPGQAARRVERPSLLGPYRQVLAGRGVVPILLGNVLERSVYATVGLYLASFMMQTYRIDLLAVAPLLALMAIGTIVGNVVGGRLADSGSMPRIYAVGQLVSAAFALTYFATDPGLVGSVVLGASFGLINAASRPAIIAMASAFSAEHRGTALGIFSFSNQIGWTAGPAVASLGFALAGYPTVGLLCGLAAALAAASMLALRHAP